MTLLLTRRVPLSIGAIFVLASCSGAGGSGSLPQAAQAALQATSAVASPSLVWSPQTNGTFDYGTLTSGSTTQKFTLTNTGRAGADALKVRLALGSGSAGFAITANGCSGKGLGPRKTCTVTVKYGFTVDGESDSATLTASGISENGQNGNGPAVSASLTLTGKSAVPSQMFNYTGAEQTFTVPDGISHVTVDAIGAKGADFSSHFRPGPGGRGAEVVATLPVTAGATLYVFVGGNGNFSNTTGAGGFNGGGAGEFTNANGGGASDVRVGADDVNHRVIVAAGGGAGTSDFFGTGGDAGYASGQAGVAGSPGCVGATAGGGATQSAGGTGGMGGVSPFTGPCPDGTAGILGQGGSNSENGGGGGGGYYGGGAGGDASGGGGGSSNVLSPATYVSSKTATDGQCDTSNNGCIKISY